MYLTIYSAKVNNKGFMSFFSKKSFTLCLNAIDFHEEIKLKSKTSFIGYITEIPSTTIDLILTIKYCGEIIELHKIEVIKDNIISIKSSNSLFEGMFRLGFSDEDLFLSLENGYLVDDNKEPIKTFSYECGKMFDSIFIRKTYKNAVYLADIDKKITSLSTFSIPTIEDLPKGWEKKTTKSGNAYYINHNKCTTHWEHPNSQKFKSDLALKMQKYKNRIEPKNILIYYLRNKFQINARRDFWIQSTAYLFLNSNRNDFQREPFVKIYNEIGEDHGAIIKEFYYCCSLEISRDPRMKISNNLCDVKTDAELLIEKSGEEITVNFSNINIEKENDYALNLDMSNPFYTDNNVGKNFLNDNDFYKYVGVFLASAIEFELNIGIDFSLPFYENLLKRNFKFSQIQDFEMQKNLDFILKNDVSDLNIVDESGVEINEDSKFEYIHRIIKFYLFDSKRKSYGIIRKEFYGIVDRDFSNVFDANDFSAMLSGDESLTFQMIKKSVNYVNCKETDKNIVFLFNVLKKKDEIFLRKFIQYATGTPTIPIQTIKNNSFKWSLEISDIPNALIRAITCSNKIYIGKYVSESNLEERLIYSMENTKGFHKI